MLYKKKIAFIALFSFLLLLIHQYDSKAQGFENGNNISLSLLKDSLNLSPGQFGFNVLTITNFGAIDMSFGGKAMLPQGWTLLKEFPNHIFVPAGQTVSIPIRIRSNAVSYGGVKYPIKLEIFDPQSGNTSRSFFDCHINENTSWKAELLEPTKFVSDAETLPDFRFRIENRGNRIEGFDIDFKSGFNLTVPSDGFQLFLKPGTDTTITIGIRSRTLDQLSDQVRVQIRARNTNKVLIQKIFIVTDLYIPRENTRYSLPLNLQWSGSNLLEGERIFQSIDFNTYFNLKNDSRISMRYRSMGMGRSNNSKNNFFELNYSFKNGNVSFGNYQDLQFVLLDGIGVSFDHSTHKNSFKAFAIKGRIASDYSLGVKVENKLKKEITLSHEAFYVENQQTKLSDVLGVHELASYKNVQSNFKITGGYSYEQSKLFNHAEIGYTGGAQINKELKWFSLRSNFNTFSTYFPGVNRGMTYHNHDLRFKLGQVFIGAFGNQVHRKPGVFNFDFTEVAPRFAIKNEEYGLQFGIKGERLNLMARVMQVGQLQFNEGNPPMAGSKAMINIFTTKAKFQQYYQFYALKSTFGRVDQLANNMTYGSYINFRYKGFGINSKFDYGPNFYFDFLYLDRTGTLPIRNQHSIYFQNQNGKYIRNRTSVHYYSLSRNTTSSLQVSNDTYIDIPKLGLNLNFSVSTNLMEINRSPILSVSVNKSLNIPLPFFKKFNTLKLSLFKDNNNNNVYDEGEESVNGATIKVNDKFLSTNGKGEVQLQNVKKGNYVIDYQSVDNQYGWKTKSITRDTVKLQKDKTVYISFKKTNTISGKINVERAPYSINKAPDLLGIKVIAINLNGETFQTLTDENGNFFFNLSDDIYVVQIPTNLYGNIYKFDQSKFQVNLFEQRDPTIELNLVEKSRKLNIKKAVDPSRP
ncbi:hypothetical protein SAMN06298216_0966 [Spirosomataceae bacterium TFI 002]|nr:hypothetical protein SAMN06298216_0966 [Spirosomataceae bacterium TFI 002]